MCTHTHMFINLYILTIKSFSFKRYLIDMSLSCIEIVLTNYVAFCFIMRCILDIIYKEDFLQTRIMH